MCTLIQAHFVAAKDVKDYVGDYVGLIYIAVASGVSL